MRYRVCKTNTYTDFTKTNKQNSHYIAVENKIGKLFGVYVKTRNQQLCMEAVP